MLALPLSQGFRGAHNPDDRVRRIISADRYQNATQIPLPGRRVGKKSDTWQGSSWSLAYERRFVWVEWAMIAEADANLNPVRSYLWGLDLAEQRSAQQTTPHRRFFGAGAGGVGGLVAMTTHGSTTHTHPVSSDANGNVVAVGTDTIFEYDAFGNTLRATGPLASQMPFRFSTKYVDSETGLSYYGYRYYSPSMGRFLNRDPIGERGGLNLYAFVGNDPVNRWDYLGLSCGPGRIGDWFVPDGFPGGINFRPACKEHDECYANCNVTRSECDAQFLEALLRACEGLSDRPGPTRPRPPGQRPPQQPPGSIKEQCENLARTYYSAVSRFGESSCAKARRSECCKGENNHGCSI